MHLMSIHTYVSQVSQGCIWIYNLDIISFISFTTRARYWYLFLYRGKVTHQVLLPVYIHFLEPVDSSDLFPIYRFVHINSLSKQAWSALILPVWSMSSIPWKIQFSIYINMYWRKYQTTRSRNSGVWSLVSYGPVLVRHICTAHSNFGSQRRHSCILQ